VGPPLSAVVIPYSHFSKKRGGNSEMTWCGISKCATRADLDEEDQDQVGRCLSAGVIRYSHFFFYFFHRMTWCGIHKMCVCRPPTKKTKTRWV
jgi:hypothetical protein